jgi:hypothetical protein
MTFERQLAGCAQSCFHLEIAQAKHWLKMGRSIPASLVLSINATLADLYVDRDGDMESVGNRIRSGLA